MAGFSKSQFPAKGRPARKGIGNDSNGPEKVEQFPNPRWGYSVWATPAKPVTAKTESEVESAWSIVISGGHPAPCRRAAASSAENTLLNRMVDNS